MAQEIVGVKIQVEGNASESIGSLKKQLREAQNEVTALSEKFGATSQQAVQAAKRAAELKDAIGDAKALTDAFNPDRKFQAFASALTGVVGGISAVQGAMGLLGVENEAVEQTLLKVNSAMALSQGLNSVLEARDSFKNLGTVIKSTTIFQKANNVATTAAIALQKAFGVATIGTGRAFTILKGAIAATGIGLLVVGVSALVNKIMDWTSSTEDNEKAQNSLNDTIEYQNRLLDENLKSISNVNRLQVLRAKEAGKSVKEIYDIEVQGLRDQAKALKDSYNARLQYEETPEFRKLKLEDQRKYYDESNKINQQYVDKNNELALKEQEFRTQSADTQRQESKKNSEDYKNRIKEEQEQRRKLLDDRIAFEDEIDELRKKKFEQNLEFIKNREVYFEEKAQEATGRLEKRIQEVIVPQLENQNKIRSEYYQADLEATKYLQEQKVIAVERGLDLIGALAGRNEAIGNILFTIQKAIEIGKIVTSTASAIAQVKAATAAVPTILPPGVPNPAFAAAVAAGTKKILGLKIGAAASIASIAASTIAKFKGGAGGSNLGGGEQGGIGGAAAPIAPQLPQAQLTQLDQQTINRLGSATSRAYVVESDVTNSQERIRRINRAARLN